MKSLLIALVLYISSVDQSVAEPPCHSIIAEKCLDPFIDFLSTLPKGAVVETEDEMNRFCDSYGYVLDCWAKFRKDCMTPVQKQLDDFLFEGLDISREMFCSPGSTSRAQYLSHAKCLNTVATGENVPKLLHYLQAIIERVLTTNEGSLAMFCCAYTYAHSEVENEVTAKCGADATKSVNELIEAVITDYPNMICGTFDSNGATCQKALPPKDIKPTGSANNSPIYEFLLKFFANYI